jgi:hypothetical protein
MIILRIEHPVPDYNAWKIAFDNDPVDRKGSGVKRYSIFQPLEDPNYVIIDLEFDTADEAKGLLNKLHNLWKTVEGKIIFDPKATILKSIDLS